jgi:catechol-2,3-dioxygenase
MADTLKQETLYGIIIRARNVEKMRSFYRDVIDLGPPVVDSNYWVEFKISSETNLILEQIEADDQNSADAPKRGATSWVRRVDDVDAFIAKLGESKIEPVGEERERFGRRVVTFLDPEGNAFHIISEKT